MDPADEDILALLATDLDRYYERLVLKYWLPLRAFVLRRTGSLQDAEDIVQEAYERAYIALERYPAERVRALKVRPWLYKITWNVYCNYTGRTKPPPTVSLDILDSSGEGSLIEWEDEAREQPEEVLASAEQRQELESLVATLPPRYREVVSLYYFEELSHQEIADMLNQPVGKVRVYVHRGIRLLRKAMAVQTNEGE